MNRIPIREPRWHDRVVLVADWKLTKDNLIDIGYAPKGGELSFPAPLYISGQKAQTYPIEKIATKNGSEVSMRVIPLDDFDVYIEE